LAVRRRIKRIVAFPVLIELHQRADHQPGRDQIVRADLQRAGEGLGVIVQRFILKPPFALGNRPLHPEIEFLVGKGLAFRGGQTLKCRQDADLCRLPLFIEYGGPLDGLVEAGRSVAPPPQAGVAVIVGKNLRRAPADKGLRLGRWRERDGVVLADNLERNGSCPFGAEFEPVKPVIGHGETPFLRRASRHQQIAGFAAFDNRYGAACRFARARHAEPDRLPCAQGHSACLMRRACSLLKRDARAGKRCTARRVGSQRRAG
jgi:hypothetical protein